MRKLEENITDISFVRDVILEDYTVKDGIIQSPGKFEGSPVFVPYYYEMRLMGMWDDTFTQDGRVVDIFDISIEEKRIYPELSGHKRIAIWNDCQGFAYYELD